MTLVLVMIFNIGIALSAMNSRRFPPPWSVEELNDACFIVRDHNGQQLAYVYFRRGAGATIGGEATYLQIIKHRMVTKI